MRNGLQFLLFSALLHITFSVHQFVLVSQLMNWTDAKKYCRQHYIDLATIDDQEDHDHLMKTIGAGTEAWIGLHRTTDNGPFFWLDQSSSSFRKWGSAEQGGYWGVTVKNGYWYDNNRRLSFPFVCHVDRNIQIVKLEVKSSEDLNDPEVMNKILLKMEQILKEKGLAGDAKLSWRIQSDGNVFQKKEKREKRNTTEETFSKFDGK